MPKVIVSGGTVEKEEPRSPKMPKLEGHQSANGTTILTAKVESPVIKSPSKEVGIK